MGVIRKTMAVGSLGVVNGSSKKQRVARASMQSAQRSEAMFQRQALAEQQRADHEAEYRYATDPQYRAFIDAKRAQEEAARQQRLATLAARRHTRSVRLQQAVVMPVLGLTMMVLALVVWAPQMAVGAARHRQVVPWMRDQLAGTWRKVLHRG